MRLALLAGLCAWAGSALLLSRLRWFSRPPLAERLRPYATVPSDANPRRGLWSVASFRDAIVPLATATGGRVAAVFGVDEDAGTRLARVHSPLATNEFRVRQLTSAAVGLAIGLLVATAIGIAAIGALCILGLPLLGFLVPEQRLASESDDWRRRTFLELPVVAEQLGMLLSAGYSLGGALNRLAARGKGCCGRDLQRVCGRLRQGVGDVDALREWAELARVDALDRLVAVLALNREAADLGRLIADEARSIRRDVHRQLIETVERRAQQVWVPVTVATLVPGVIFLAIPFIEAMRLFTAS